MALSPQIVESDIQIQTGKSNDADPFLCNNWTLQFGRDWEITAWLSPEALLQYCTYSCNSSLCKVAHYIIHIAALVTYTLLPALKYEENTKLFFSVIIVNENSS